MKKLISLVLVAFFGLLFTTNPVFSASSLDNDVELLLFYGEGCPHCAKAKVFLDEISKKYPTLNLEQYEVYSHQEDRDFFKEVMKHYNKDIGAVPTFVIDGEVLIGFSDKLGANLENKINSCLKSTCSSYQKTLKVIPDSKVTPSSHETLTIAAVISAAIVDAINPCAFAVLIILLTTIIATKKRRRALFAGLAFSLSIYISYLLMGLGLYSAIKIGGFVHSFYIIVSIFAIIIGLLNLKDYFFYGKWFVMEVPMSWRPKLKTLIRNVTSVTGAFLIGFIVSLFLLPCTSGPYIVILGLLSSVNKWAYAFSLLLLYNFVFVLPMLLITLAIYFGFTTTEAAEQWRQKKLKVLHLIAGLIILSLGVGMLIALKLGYL